MVWGFPFEVMKILWIQAKVLDIQNVNILQITGLYTFRWLKSGIYILRVLPQLKKQTKVMNFNPFNNI